MTGGSHSSPDGRTCRSRSGTRPAHTARLSPVTLTATVAYPYVDRQRATLALRGELLRQAVARRVTPHWSSLIVRGPLEEAGAHRRTWYVWTGSVSCSGE